MGLYLSLAGLNQRQSLPPACSCLSPQRQVDEHVLQVTGQMRTHVAEVRATVEQAARTRT